MIFPVYNTKNQWKCYRFFLLCFCIVYRKEKGNRKENKKAPQQRPNGWKLASSPDCNIDRTFSSIFYFPHKAPRTRKIVRTYRNPIHLAREYKQMIDNGQVKNQSALAKLIGISRVRITQILNLLKLDSRIIQKVEKLGDPLKGRIITERRLRLYINNSLKE